MAIWCLWPLTGVLLGVQASPAPAVSSLYLAGCWGAPWLLGRIWFGTTSDQVLFLKACAWAGLACLPLAVIEGGLGISVYSALFGQHPYFADGWNRYVGFRPIGLFENGNQYGIWVSLSAFAAIWTAATLRSFRYIALAFLATAVAIASQSVGAILLMGLGLTILAVWRLRIVWPLLVIGLCCVGTLAALHLSGIVPLQWIARDTAIGRGLLDGFRAIGRGSFLWRISQDIKTLDIVHDAFATGTMVWDWWRPANIRPWGLWMLILGQFGIIGFLLAYGSLFGPVGQAMRKLRGAAVWTTAATALPLSLIVLMAMADSALNAFLYFPAILAAGALTSGAHIRN